MTAIAIIGMACRYALARSPRELWKNVLAQRQAFRRIPSSRLRIEDYAQGEDRISARMAAVIEDYEFDRTRFHVSKDTYNSTDIAHWLALEIAAEALADARLLDANESQRERMGVYVGNSLTGEFSRAGLMRLRWPYVQRVLMSVLQSHSHSSEEAAALTAEVEALYKAPFPPTTEDTLAGGLSNTIAGRICNHFDLKGGGYTIDGACASSLLAVITACSALESGDIDIALAGGVDLSIDPFELAGFSKLGALSSGRMRVYDERSSGFIPGEGCGMVALMRHEDALARQHSIYATIRGWGISSDGSGGITRPETEGQMIALRRAYQKAGYGVDSVLYFEGHGTGTAVGDAAELQALGQIRRAADAEAQPAAIGSVKANIGHTKAAAGIAGLIKAAMAVHARVLPPTTGCERPHSLLADARPMLRVLREGEIWPDSAPARAGVSAMGFGGINTHITLESTETAQRTHFTSFEIEHLSPGQDCELFIFQAENAEELARRLEDLLQYAGGIAFAEMPDLAAQLASRTVESPGAIRAACVASTPDELESGLQRLHGLCLSGATEVIDPEHGVFLSARRNPVRIGFLFPGQGSPVAAAGAIWSRRIPSIHALYEQARLPRETGIATEIAQPCLVAASLAGLEALAWLGIEATVALGHSLGEITALAWAGAFTNGDLLRIVSQRGRIMAETADPAGAMASIRADWQSIKSRINGDPLVIAAYNSPRQTVVSGETQAVRHFAAKLASDGIATVMLPVSHAFHSPLVADAATAFSGYLANERFGSLRRRVASTVTGTLLQEDADLRALLSSQITLPVKFADALALAAQESDLLIEVGSGSVLSGIAMECGSVPAISLKTGDESLRGLLLAAGATFALGGALRVARLFERRWIRPFDLTRRPSFLQNPCETAPASLQSIHPEIAVAPSHKPVPADDTSPVIDVLLNLVARRTELPPASIRKEDRFLDDLHLNSITISQIILEAAESLAIAAPSAPAEYTNATIAEAAQTLDELRRHAKPAASDRTPAGIAPWMRTLGVEMIACAPRPRPAPAAGTWQIATPQNHSMPDGFVERLRDAFTSVPGSGVLCCVPAARDADTAAFLLKCVKDGLQRNAKQFVFLQQEAGAAALARTLHLEHPDLQVTVIDLPFDHPRAGEWASLEAHTARGFTETHYDRDGERREPRLRLLWPEASATSPALGDQDLLLVTGGGKGISAECALDLARRTGCRLALIGRSQPSLDHELKKNLQRFTDQGIAFRYYSADIAVSAATAAVLRQIESEMGGITAVLHGAGANLPRRIEEITSADLQAALGPKLGGLRNILGAIGGARLRLLITFGSILGRTGLHGEAHYGLANEWMRQEVEEWQGRNQHCRCLNLEWSVWAGAGMGQKLGVLESLVRQGITPLPLEDAIRQLETMLAWKEAPVSSIVSSRIGNLPTLAFSKPELPLLRFLERVQVYYPGIELIADAELSNDTDLYLPEHVVQGEQLIPAVIVMEAMTQVAMTLEESSALPELRGLRFDLPIVVPRGRPVTMRVAALRQQPGVITVAVRCSSTSFQTDHFSGECVFLLSDPHSSDAPAADARHEPAAGGRRVRLEPERDLYGGILFHEGRFRSLRQYRRLCATSAVAELAPPAPGPWHARHLPPEFRMGNAAARDAAIHCLQACIPHKIVLPAGVDRIVPQAGWTGGMATVHATERVRDGNNFLFDLWIRDARGELCERWEGLHLRAIAPTVAAQPWPRALLAPYLERKLNEMLSSGICVRLLLGTKEEREAEAHEIAGEIASTEAKITHRPDGKPEISGSHAAAIQVSRSHTEDLMLLAFSHAAVGCDAEPLAGRSEAAWRGLLNSDEIQLAQLLASRSGASLDSAATQIWTLRECLRKAGASLGQTLRLDSCPEPGWAVFSGGGFRAATWTAHDTPATGGAFGFVTGKAQ